MTPTTHLADRVFFGGPMVTMEDDLPSVEALAVKGGVIARVGSLAAVEELRGPDTEMVGWSPWSPRRPRRRLREAGPSGRTQARTAAAHLILDMIHLLTS